MKKLINFKILAILIVLSSLDKVDSQCSDNEFQCHDGSCIKLKLKCDSDNDCSDGSDEFSETCNPPTEPPTPVPEPLCPKNQFQCDDGTCIKLKLKCDGDDDCSDGSDEAPKICQLEPPTTTTATTTAKPCPGNQFHCSSSGICIKLKLVCDNDQDCPDGEDEAPELCSQNLIEDVPQVQMKLAPSQTEIEIEAAEAPEDDTTEFPLTSRTDEDDETIRESLRIIQAGDEHIDDDDNYRDVILMAGISGAGKTTLTKFVTGDNTDLTSYWSGQRFSIRDEEGRISSGRSTVVSKSIFPKMMVNKRTNAAFFDLPGFGDNRGAAVDLANAVFIKRVADRARRLKIIFVVNFSSMRPGEIRSDFKNLLEHATSFVKSASKYRTAIALIANKVDADVPHEKIIPGIAQFLTNARESLNQIVEDEIQRENCRHLIDSLLLKDRKGKIYLKLGYLKQPAEAGSLSKIVAFQTARAALEKMIFDNTRFVAKSTDDFGLSVAPSTKLFVRNAVGHLYANMAVLTEDLSGEIRNYFMHKFGDALNVYQLIRQFRNGLEILENKTEAISNLISQGQTSNSKRQELLSLMRDMTQSIQLNDPDQVLVETMARNLDHLDFLEPLLANEKVEGQLSWVTDSWTSPLREALLAVEQTIYSISQTVNSVVGATMALIAHELKSLYANQIEAQYDSISNSNAQFRQFLNAKNDQETINLERANNGTREFLEGMKSDSKLLENLCQKLMTSKSITTFFKEGQGSLEKLEIVSVPSTLLQLMSVPPPELEEGQNQKSNSDRDFDLSDHQDRLSPYTPGLWIGPLEELQAYLDENSQTMTGMAKDSKNDDATDQLKELFESRYLEYDSQRSSLQTELQRVEKDLAGVDNDINQVVQIERQIVEDTAAGFEVRAQSDLDLNQVTQELIDE